MVDNLHHHRGNDCILCPDAVGRELSPQRLATNVDDVSYRNPALNLCECISADCRCAHYQRHECGCCFGVLAGRSRNQCCRHPHGRKIFRQTVGGDLPYGNFYLFCWYGAAAQLCLGRRWHRHQSHTRSR